MAKKSENIKCKFENVQLKKFMNSILNDEIYIPLNTSPLKNSTR